MRVLAIVHEAERDTGTIGERVIDRGFELEVADAPSGLPAPGWADAVVVYGSAEAAYDDSVPWLRGEIEFLEATVAARTPVLGICFGGQILSRVLGGTVTRSPHPETGWVTIATDQPALVPPGPWMEFHFDRFTLPPGGVAVARSDHALQAFTHGSHLGLQFHPEITPLAFDRWIAEWRSVGALEHFAQAGIDIDRIRDEIAERAHEARHAAMALFDAFLERALEVAPRHQRAMEA